MRSSLRLVKLARQHRAPDRNVLDLRRVDRVWVALENSEIGELARYQTANLFLHANHIGGIDRNGAECPIDSDALTWRHASPCKARLSFEVFALGIYLVNMLPLSEISTSKALVRTWP